MFSSNEEVVFNQDVVDNADAEFDTDGPVQIVLRWDSADDIDLNGLIFDENANFLGAAY